VFNRSENRRFTGIELDKGNYWNTSLVQVRSKYIQVMSSTWQTYQSMCGHDMHNTLVVFVYMAFQGVTWLPRELNQTWKHSNNTKQIYQARLIVECMYANNVFVTFQRCSTHKSILITMLILLQSGICVFIVLCVWPQLIYTAIVRYRFGYSWKLILMSSRKRECYFKWTEYTCNKLSVDLVRTVSFKAITVSFARSIDCVVIWYMIMCQDLVHMIKLQVHTNMWYCLIQWQLVPSRLTKFGL
jgi:hypothetical protein